MAGDGPTDLMQAIEIVFRDVREGRSLFDTWRNAMPDPMSEQTSSPDISRSMEAVRTYGSAVDFHGKRALEQQEYRALLTAIRADAEQYAAAENARLREAAETVLSDHADCGHALDVDEFGRCDKNRRTTLRAALATPEKAR